MQDSMNFRRNTLGLGLAAAATVLFGAPATALAQGTEAWLHN
jgi:hypothetical protein